LQLQLYYVMHCMFSVRQKVLTVLVSSIVTVLMMQRYRYAAGTTPWGNPGSHMANFEPQRHDDGYLEVIGFTTASLVSADYFLSFARVLLTPVFCPYCQPGVSCSICSSYVCNSFGLFNPKFSGLWTSLLTNKHYQYLSLSRDILV